MKKISILVVLATFIVSLFGGGSTALAASRVSGYTTKKGTYVQPYYRSSANTTRYDNFSTKGNYNTYTGKKGYVKPYTVYKFR